MKISIVLFILIWLSGACFGQSSQEGNPYYSLSKEERWELLKEIAMPIALGSEGGMPTREIHRRFWEIVDKYKWTPQELEASAKLGRAGVLARPDGQDARPTESFLTLPIQRGGN